MQINVSVTDANNIVCEVVPPQPQVIVIDRGVEGNGIVSIVPVTISTFQYLRITYTNGTVQDVGPLTSTAYTATAPITIVGNTISLATVPIASGGTDATTAAGAIQNLLPSYTGNANKRLGLNSTATALEWVLDGGGTVTSVAASGGTTGLTFTGSPITTSGTLTLGGTLAIANGGTGQTTANAALNALLPSQTGNASKYLQTDGTNATWDAISLSTADITGILGTANGGTGLGGSTPFTANGVVYASSTSALTTGSALVFDGTNLGIGTSSPQYKLDVTSNIAINGIGGNGYGLIGYAGATPSTGFRFSLTRQDAISSGSIYLNSYGAIGFGINKGSTGTPSDTPNMLLDTSGNLGLGVTPSVWNSTFKAMDIGSYASVFCESSVTADIASNIYYKSGTGWTYRNTNYATMLRQEGGAYKFYNAPSGTAGATATFTQAMTLDASGNLGVGTTSPSAKLDVVANDTVMAYFRSSGGSANDKRFTITSGGNRVVLDSSNNSTGTASDLSFMLGGAEQMRLTTTGLGIGTSSPSYKLHVAGAPAATSGALIYVRDTTAAVGTASLGGIAFFSSPGSDFYVGKKNNTAGTGWLSFGNADNGTEYMALDASGNLGIGTTSPTQKLDVNGNIRTTGEVALSGADFVYSWAGGTTGQRRSGFYLDGTNNVLRFYTNQSEVGRFDSSGNLGIGTSSPTRKLTVAATNANMGLVSADTGYSELYFSDSSGSPGAISYDHNNDLMAFYTNGSNRLIINSSGNLGLGVTPSAWSTGKAFQIGSTTSVLNDGSGNTYWGNNFYYNSGFKYLTTAGSVSYVQTGSEHRWNIAPSGTAGNSATFNQVMSLSQNSGSTMLAVTSNYVSGAIATLRINAPYYNDWDLIVDGPLRFSTGGVEKMRLDSSGNLGLGVTPSAWASSARAIQVGSYSGFYQNASGLPEISFNSYQNTSNVDTYRVSANTAGKYQVTEAHKWFTAPSGTAGNAISWTQAMTLDASGNLGIGTTSPYSKLDLGSYGSQSQLSWHQDATTAYGYIGLQNNSAAIGLLSGLKMGASANSFASSISSLWGKSAILLNYGNIQFFTNTPDTVSYGTTYTPTERARIDSSGNLGVGTSSPNYRTTIYQAASNVDVLTIGNQQINGDGVQRFVGLSFQDDYINGTGNASAIRSYSNLYSAWGSTLTFWTTGTSGNGVVERARINSSGYLGINTSSPGVYLDVNGNYAAAARFRNLYTFAGQNYAIAISGDGATVGYISQNPAAGGIVIADGMRYYGGGPWTPDSTSASSIQQLGGNIIFTTNAGLTGGNFTPSERARIASSGSFLVGTTTDYAKFSVQHAQNSYIAYFSNTNNASGDQVLRTVLGTNANNTSSYHFVGTAGGADKIYIYGNGNIVNSNNSYGALSDAKLKENIVDTTPKLADLMQVKVRNYNLIGESTKQLGVVAQELETVFPAMVDETPDKDAEGNDLGTTTKSVKYSVFVPMLIKALQEQQAIIESLKARLDAANL